MPLRRAPLTVLGASLATLLLCAGVAVAIKPAGLGVIDGCYKRSTGALRVLDAGGSCKRGETAISWNQQGPAGAEGPQGPAGS